MIMAQENALLKAKEEFQKIEETIRQETIQGKQIDVVEENLCDQIWHQVSTNSDPQQLGAGLYGKTRSGSPGLPKVGAAAGNRCR